MDIELIKKPRPVAGSYFDQCVAQKASGEPDWLYRKRIRHLYHGRP